MVDTKMSAFGGLGGGLGGLIAGNGSSLGLGGNRSGLGYATGRTEFAPGPIAPPSALATREGAVSRVVETSMITGMRWGGEFSNYLADAVDDLEHGSEFARKIETLNGEIDSLRLRVLDLWKWFLMPSPGNRDTA